MYALLDCIEESVGRQADDEDLGDWQYEVLSKYYTPQFEVCECKIGKDYIINKLEFLFFR